MVYKAAYTACMVQNWIAREKYRRDEMIRNEIILRELVLQDFDLGILKILVQVFEGEQKEFEGLLRSIESDRADYECFEFDTPFVDYKEIPEPPFKEGVINFKPHTIYVNKIWINEVLKKHSYSIEE
jgi:hypothetical protein